VYDEAYLELAMRQGLPLATLDEGLKHAAGEAGVEVVGGVHPKSETGS
jgi:predicted nucleic acid-binding protein